MRATIESVSYKRVKGKVMVVSTAERGMWGYPDEAAAGRDLTGWSIEAVDGGIGKVDNANNEAGASWLIVDTGPWIFGKRVMLPAGVVDRINSENEVVHVNRTKEQIKNAPELVEGHHHEQTYRDELGVYYSQGGRGYRE